jgi:hypothetical protein
VQALPSSQAVPSTLTRVAQVPDCGSQTPGWQASSHEHATGVPMQMPPWQVSFWVQGSSSLQALPSGLVGLVQAPDCGSQTPGWQASTQGQTTVAPAQTPAWQASFWVQGLPSSQAVPLGLDA